MKLITLSHIALFLSLLTANAQSSHLDKIIGDSEARIKKSLSEMVNLDTEIEGVTQELVELIAKHSDSTDSKTRVADTKIKAIEALEESIAYYAKIRQSAETDIKKRLSTLSKEDLAKRIDLLDERIDQRVDQIIQLSASFEQHKGYKKYNTHQNNWNGTVYTERNTKQKANERNTTKGANKNSKLMDELSKAVEDLTRRNNLLENQLSRARNETDIETLSKEIHLNNERMGKRRKQMRALIDAPKAATKNLNQKQAHNLEKLIRDTTSQYQTKIRKLRSLKSTVDLERGRLEGYKRSKARSTGK